MPVQSSHLNKKSLTRKYFQKNRLRLIEGTVNEITPEVTWLYTLDGSRIPLNVPAEDVSRVAQANDTIRAIVNTDSTFIYQIYSPNTTEHLKINEVNPHISMTLDNSIYGCDLTGGTLFALIPGFGLLTSWMALLFLLINTVASLKRGRNFLILLAVVALYLCGVGFIDSSKSSTPANITVFIFNCFLLFFPLYIIRRDAEKGDLELTKILQKGIKS